jgi:16S rRNA (guanine1207-N2)-methyltransferase
VLGWVAAQHGATVTFVDDNLLAVESTRALLAHHELEPDSAQPSDVFSALENQTFDVIISNPPFHRSFDVNTNVSHRLLREAKAHLNPNGRLVLVANAFLKYESVADEHFRSIRTQDNGKYKIIDARL